MDVDVNARAGLYAVVLLAQTRKVHSPSITLCLHQQPKRSFQAATPNIITSAPYPHRAQQMDGLLCDEPTLSGGCCIRKCQPLEALDVIVVLQQPGNPPCSCNLPTSPPPSSSSSSKATSVPLPETERCGSLEKGSASALLGWSVRCWAEISGNCGKRSLQVI